MTKEEKELLYSNIGNLKRSPEWRCVIDEYLFKDFLKEQRDIIANFCDRQDSDEYKNAFKAKQSIEWFRGWVEATSKEAQDYVDSLNDYRYNRR